MKSTVGSWDIWKYLQEYGWTPPQLIADQLRVSLADLSEVLMDMEKADMIVQNGEGWVNIPLSSRGRWAKFWARWFGY